MLRELGKGVVILATTAVAIPYAIAAVCNILYGWPQSEKRFKRAFHPKKVFYLNCRVLKKFLQIRYLPLLIRWKRFYAFADKYQLLKDIPYGRNDQTLDLYFPLTSSSRTLKPVVVFVYGGSWGSGDKSMYGLLCSQLADRLQAIVCCPNYSLYPQGYVDDMIQDVVDCVAWIYENINEHGGNKDKLMLMGHSAGAHLAVMAVLELLHDEWVHGIKIDPPQLDPIDLDERHFDGSNGEQDGSDKPASSEGSSASFDVLNGNNGELKRASGSGIRLDSSSSFVVLSREESLEDVAARQLLRTTSKMSESAVVVDMEAEEKMATAAEKETSSRAGVIGGEELSSRGGTTETEIDTEELEEIKDGDGSDFSIDEGRDGDEDDEEDDMSNKDEEDSVITVRPCSIDRQPTLIDLGKCIKGVIGLAGVYDIGEHFVYESSWGVEDISAMSRAMYGQDHFDRFSPSLIVKNLTRSVRLPVMVLAHGARDDIVPISSTTSFAGELSDIFADVTVKIVPECNHYDICLDMMDVGRMYYDTIMNIAMETGQKIF